MSGGSSIKVPMLLVVHKCSYTDTTSDYSNSSHRTAYAFHYHYSIIQELERLGIRNNESY